MKKIKPSAILKIAIRELENKQAVEFALLKDQFLYTYESIKPFNFIKNTIKEITSSTNFKDDLLGTSAGLAAGYLSKEIVVMRSHNPLKKLLGTIVQLGISTVVAKNPEAIKLIAGKIINLIGKKKITSHDS